MGGIITPTEELRNDLVDSMIDMQVARMALRMGIRYLVHDGEQKELTSRIGANQLIVDIALDELVDRKLKEKTNDPT